MGAVAAVRDAAARVGQDVPAEEIGAGAARAGELLIQPGDGLGRSWRRRDDRGMSSDDALARVRAACLALPEVTERPSHGSPAWFVRGRKTFVMFLDNHHDDGRLAIWCAAPAGEQEALVISEPDRFFRPPYVGHRGWLGVRLDVDVDWDEIGGIVEEAYRTVAPRTLVATLDAQQGGGP